MVHWWNNNDGGKPKYLEKKLSQCHFTDYKFNVDWHGIEPGPQWRQAATNCLRYSTTWSLSDIIMSGRGKIGMVPHQRSLSTVMRCITTFHSTTDCIYDSGPIRLQYYNFFLEKPSCCIVLLTKMSFSQDI